MFRFHACRPLFAARTAFSRPIAGRPFLSAASADLFRGGTSVLAAEQATAAASARLQIAQAFKNRERLV